MKKRILSFVRDQSGAIAAISALGITAFLGFAAITIDVGHMTKVRNELQRTADSAALAGARGLYPNNLATMDPTLLVNYAPDTTQAYSRANVTFTGNLVDGNSLCSDQVSVQAGIYNWSDKSFTPSASNATNAVLVQINNHVVQHTFAPILGRNNGNISVKALAVMDYVSALPPGTIPIAIGKKYLGQVNQPLVITFDPATSDTAGWFSKPPDSASANTLKNYIDNGSCPPIAKGDIINLNNGDVTSALQALENLASAYGVKNNSGNWDVDLPVVDSTQFNENKPIESFVKFRITYIKKSGNNKRVEGMILALGLSRPGANPGGPESGLLAPPVLVAYD